MSDQAARDALARLNSDASFRERVLCARSGAGRIAILNAAGYACTAEELDTEATMLTEADLDRVTGGVGTMMFLDHRVE